MEKEQNQNQNLDQEKTKENEKNEVSPNETPDASKINVKDEDKIIEKTAEEKILELEDKLARTFAEMENQRRRFEKEKEEAYEYGGFAFAKESLNLIDNLERSKQILLNDETLKNSEALKKTLEHFDIINKDLMTIFSKNNIKPIESLNKKLNPNLHQAMMEIEDDSNEPVQ